MPFAVTMIWREPKDHISDCYFCLIPLINTMKIKANFRYPNLPSAIRPVPHSDTLPVSMPPKDYSLDFEKLDDRGNKPSTSKNPDFQRKSKMSKSKIKDGIFVGLQIF